MGYIGEPERIIEAPEPVPAEQPVAPEKVPA